MTLFSYTALDKNGGTYQGKIEAADKFGVYHEIKQKGDTVVSVEDPRRSSSVLNISLDKFFTSISMHERIIFARNLGTMLDAGLPVSRALDVMRRQTRNVKLKEVLESLVTAVGEGITLSNAMQKHPKVFPPLTIAMISAGEESGALSAALQTVADQMEKVYVLGRKVKGAFIYPAVIVCAMILIGILMFIYVVPVLTTTFQELHVDLPWSTQLIIGISNLFQHHGLLLLLGVVLASLGVYFFVKSAVGKKFFDWSVIRIPIVGQLVKETYAARTARTLSSLLSAGVSVGKALSITSEVMQNRLFKQVLDEAGQEIERGALISSVFARHENLYPPFVGEMIAVGEETGSLPEMLKKIAIFYEDEVSEKTKDMSTIIEPFLMIVIGVSVGFFATAMILPTYSLVDSIQ